MLALRDLSFDDVLPAPDHLDFESSSADLDLDEDLPRLRFSWRPVYHLYNLQPEEAEAWRVEGFPVTAKPDLGLSIQVSPKVKRTITFCNFRRYSWSWTTEPEGETGYSFGVCYANDELPIHPLGTTSELVVRDSLIASWERLLNHEAEHDFVQLFNHRPVHVLLDHLYQDAVKHLSRHATPVSGRRTYDHVFPASVRRKRNGEWVDIERKI